MKTIEEEIKERYEFPQYCLPDLADQIQSKIQQFRAGVEFAQRWIPIEEELPKDGVQVLIKFESYGDINFEVSEFINGKCIANNPTHWRLIDRI